MEVSIDVVIPAHNQYPLTDSCLRHLAVQTVPHRAIVYDDASNDGTPQRLAAEWPAVKVIAGGENVGFARACNAAAQQGEGEVIVLLNNDVECRPDFLERLVAPLADDGDGDGRDGLAPGGSQRGGSRVGSVAALMLQPGERLIDSIGLTCDRTLAPFPRLQGLPAERAGSPRPPLVGPAGAAAAYRRDAWEQVGGMDESITAYLEDFDLALRLRAAGWRAALAPSAVGVHLGSATYGQRSARQRRLGGFARGYLLRRYRVLRSAAGPRALLTEAIVAAGDALISRDLAALQGRLEGFRAAKGLPRRQAPPAEAVDGELSLWRSLQLRRDVYSRPTAAT
jgi:GT2 family glycosyltransferase